MTTLEQMQLKNREVSILFMQKEHSTTLKALHLEIEKLQKRCSDLQFQLAMEATYTSQEDEFREKCEKLEKEAASQKKDLSEKTDLLQKRDNRIENLEQQIRAIERKYKDELTQKQSSMNRLQRDLEDKCDQIAKLQVAPLTARTLAQQGYQHSIDGAIHTQTTSGPFSKQVTTKHFVDQYLDQSVDLSSNATKSDSIKLPSRSHRRSGGGIPENTERPRRLSSRESSGSSQHSSQHDVEESATKPLRLRPMPPPVRSEMSEGSSKSSAGGRRRRIITAQTTPNFPDVKLRPASARKLDSNSPDIETEEILRIARAQRKKVAVDFSGEKIIPPIKASYDETTRASQQLVNPRKSTSAAFQKRAAKINPSEVEIETLAVDQVINSGLRKAQEFNSYGSDA